MQPATRVNDVTNGPLFNIQIFPENIAFQNVIVQFKPYIE